MLKKPRQFTISSQLQRPRLRMRSVFVRLLMHLVRFVDFFIVYIYTIAEGLGTKIIKPNQYSKIKFIYYYEVRVLTMKRFLPFTYW